ncbi:MAG TPA: hypothetical protein VFT91_01525, partial [Dehalococcoidia bacterium]|nr:hypothetical protein [Dehalococcoidia bacterium]
SGLAVKPPEGAQDPAPAAVVSIAGHKEGDSTLADHVEVLQQPGQELIRLQGLISSIDGAAWTVGIAHVRVPVETRVIGEPVAGARAVIWAREGNDGAVDAVFVLILDQHPILAAASQ